MRPITSREGPSVAMAGFSVFGSERKAVTILPPCCPISFSVTRSSSLGGERLAPAPQVHTAVSRIMKNRERHACILLLRAILLGGVTRLNLILAVFVRHWREESNSEIQELTPHPE